jgi:thiamine monophosphate synthase
VHLLNGTGIAGISVISALFGAEDKRRAAEQLVNKSRDLFSEKNINNSGI